MSEESKQAGHQTGFHLREAEYNLKQAEKTATETKDPALLQKVIKVKETVTEIKQDLIQKLNPKKS